MGILGRLRRKQAEPEAVNPHVSPGQPGMTDEQILSYWRGVAERVPGLSSLLVPRRTKYTPHFPHPKQAAFLLLECKEALFGGAAGGGKSDTILDGALQYVDVPGYSALILRRSFADLSLPNAIMDRAAAWLSKTDAKWNDNKKTWTFPSGATLTFGYLERASDVLRYQGAEFQYIAFDELTQFTESQYRYMFSRLRRLKGAAVPVRMRAASNPGGPGHEWVKRRFLVEGKEHKRVFIPSKLEDNPSLDREEYEESLKELDPVTFQQLRNGDWSARASGKMFKREWFSVIDQAPAGLDRVRYWDLAGTEPSKKNGDPDWTVGALVGERDGVIYICDIVRMRGRPREVESVVLNTGYNDGATVSQWLEQEPGQSGVAQVEAYQRKFMKRGITCFGHRVSGPKETRWRPLSAAAEARNVVLVRGGWLSAFFDEVEAAPNGSHDDQLDAASGGMDKLVANDAWEDDWS